MKKLFLLSALLLTINGLLAMEKKEGAEVNVHTLMYKLGKYNPDIAQMCGQSKSLEVVVTRCAQKDAEFARGVTTNPKKRGETAATKSHELEMALQLLSEYSILSDEQEAKIKELQAQANEAAGNAIANGHDALDKIDQHVASVGENLKLGIDVTVKKVDELTDRAQEILQRLDRRRRTLCGGNTEME